MKVTIVSSQHVIVKIKIKKVSSLIKRTIIINDCKINNTIGNDLDDGQFIVGFSTITIEGRWYFYKRSALERLKEGDLFEILREMEANGIDIDSAFRLEVLEICWDKQELRERERFWINELDAIKRGFNIHPGGGEVQK